MMFDNDRYTDRQREILCGLGRDHRAKLGQNRRRCFWGIAVIAMIVAASLTLVYFLKPEQTTVLFFFVPVGSIVLILAVRSKRRLFRELAQLDDYNLGLYFADQDRRVVGNAEKRLKASRVSLMLLGVCCLFLAAVLFLAMKPIQRDLSACRTVEGVLESAKRKGGSGSAIELRLDGDPLVYCVEGLYADEFGWEDFMGLAQPGDRMALLADAERDGRCSIYYAALNGHVFLTEDQVLASDEADGRLGRAMSFAALAAGIGLLLSYPIYRQLVYKRALAAEIYDLSFTREERRAILAGAAEIPAESSDADAAEPARRNREELGGETAEPPALPQRIELKSPRWVPRFFLFFAAGLDVGAVCAFALIAEPADRLLFGFSLLMISLLGWLGLIADRACKQYLDGDRLVLISFGRKKEIAVSDIDRIDIRRTAALCLDRTGKKLCSLETMKTGAAEAIAFLEQCGCVITYEVTG